MKIIVNLSPTTSCKVSINENNFFIDEGDSRKLCIKFDDKFYLQVFPIDDENKYSPFIALIEYKEKTLKSKSTQISIIKFSDYTFEILISPSLQTVGKSRAKKAIKNPSGKQVDFENGKLEIKSNSKVINFNINLPLTCPKISFADNHILLSSKEKIGTHLYVVDEEANKLKYIFCNSFKLENNELICVNLLNDYAKHMQISKYNLNGGTKLSETFVAYKEPPKIIRNAKIIPYAFMQNIKAKDFKEARKYLDDSFNETLTNEALQSFFGNFCSIATPQIATRPYTICLLYKDGKNNYISRYFNFMYNEDKKVCNIFEIYT